MKVSVVIPIWIRDGELLDLTKTCLKTLEECTDKSNYELLVVDNNSFWPINCIIEKPDVYIRNKENLGNGYAWTQGAKIAKNEYILFSDNDVEFSPGWLESLVEVLDSRPDVGVVFPNTWNYRDEDSYSCKLSGFFWLTRKSLIENIGYFDERYGVANFEDSSAFMEIQKRGFKLVCKKDIKVKHFSRASCDKNKEVSKIYKRNEEYYLNDYKVFPFLDEVL